MGMFTNLDKNSRGCCSAQLLTGLAALSMGLSACSSTPTTTPNSASPVHKAQNVEGKRYCEILTVRVVPGTLQASVWNTYPYNDCPASSWDSMDFSAVAKQVGALKALKNGPRYWLMNSITKVQEGTPTTAVLGGIKMAKYATVKVSLKDLAGESAPYVAHEVNRNAAFHFNAGRTVYELTNTKGQHWVMQTFSQQVDPSLTEAQLATLGPKLNLPTGWTYSSRVLTKPLDVQTVGVLAHVIQDPLGNSYSLETSA